MGMHLIRAAALTAVAGLWASGAAADVFKFAHVYEPQIDLSRYGDVGGW